MHVQSVQNFWFFVVKNANLWPSCFSRRRGCLSSLLLSADERLETGKFTKRVRKFPPFGSEWKKRSTSGGNLQFPIGFSTKITFHFTFNRNFGIILLNGKHPNFLKNLFKIYCIPLREVFLFHRSGRISGNFLTNC